MEAPQTTATESNLGELLVDRGQISRSQLSHALHIQKRQIQRQRVGDILMDLGYLTRQRLQKVVEESGKRELLGRMLLDQGIISAQQLDAALKEQRKTRKRLGQVLQDMGLIDEEKLARTLSKQLDLAYMVPRLNMVDQGLFARLSEGFVREHCVLPISQSHGVITVLVADPADPMLRPRLEEKLRARIELAVGIATGMRNVIEALLVQRRMGGVVRPAAGEEDPLVREAGRLVVNSADMSRGLTDEATSIFDYLVWDALRQRASDIHVEPRRDHLEVRYRIDGVLSRQSEFPFALALPLFRRAEVLARLDAETTAPYREGMIPAEVDGEPVDLRVFVSRSVLGRAMVVRLFPQSTGLMELDQLGMAPKVQERYRRLMARNAGVTFFVGPKASGKTTTLYTTLARLNNGARKIVTIETPVAFALPGIVQHNIMTEQHEEIVSVIARILQHDPDMIAVGDVATPEVGAAVFRCSVMGHQTFATMHADDCAAALVRFQGFLDAPAVLRSCSTLVVAQRLVRKVCPRCARPSLPPADLLREFGFADMEAEGLQFRQGPGCVACRGTGFIGRTGIFECLPVGAEIQEAFLKGASARDIRAIARADRDFLSLTQAGLLKACHGITTLDEVRRVLTNVDAESGAREPLTLESLLRRGGNELETV